MWSLVNRHSNGQPTRCKCIPCWKKWYSIFHCHVSWPEIPQIILVIVSNEDPPFRPQRCKEQQEVLERENQSLKQAPGVRDMPNMVGCQPYLIKQILRYISRSGMHKKQFYCDFLRPDLWKKRFPLHLGKNWQNSKVDDEGSLGSWFSQRDRWNVWKLVEIHDLKHWNVEGHWDLSMFQTFCRVILCTILTKRFLLPKNAKLITHTWNHLKSGLCSYQHDLLGGGFKYFFPGCQCVFRFPTAWRWRWSGPHEDGLAPLTVGAGETQWRHPPWSRGPRLVGIYMGSNTTHLCGVSKKTITLLTNQHNEMSQGFWSLLRC